MSLDLFRLYSGINIASELSSSNANILQGSGLPGGDSGVQDSSPIGSLYLRTDVETNNQQLYYKWSTSFNSSQDWKNVVDKQYVDAVAQGLSWREPVRVIDGTSYATNANFPVTGVIDSITLADGDRVLFSNVGVAGENNVWIWNAGTSTWVEDTNVESDGDSVLVQDGTLAETQWVYNGTAWVQFGGASSNQELAYIRNFIGKTGPGAENPTYSSTNVVAQTSSLETAVGALDGAFGTGAITNDVGDNAGTNYALTDDLTFGAGTLTVTDAINELNNAIGDRSYTENNVVVDGETVATSIEKLDVAVGALQVADLTITGTNVTGTTTVDTIPLALATEAQWMVQIRSNGTPANRRSMIVHGFTDGVSAVDHSIFAVLTVGNALSGISANVAISGTDLVLTITSSTAIDYVVKRVGFSAF